MDNHKYYTLGFLFSEDRLKVALVRKDRPSWQAGFLNGIGGKIHKGEKTVDSLSREFEEEAGVKIEPSEWISKGVMKGKDWSVYVFAAFSDKVYGVRTMETEVIELLDVFDVACNRDDIISNLQFILPMCLTDNVDYGIITYK